MREKYIKSSSSIGGITQAHRKLLTGLHRAGTGPFTVSEAAEIMGIDPDRAGRLLVYWASRGWLSRIRRGVYITVPLSAQHPSHRREDPWVVAMRLYGAAYIGGWSACEHWDLTEQMFTDVVVFTTRNVRTRKQTVQDTTFILRVVPPERIWGTTAVWRGSAKLQLSDPSRTLVDILDDPRIGGGIRHIAEILANYFASEWRDDAVLLGYAHRRGNQTVFKRLGYLVETLRIDAQDLLAYCQAHLSAGYSRLDPTVSSTGRYRRKWNLEVNVQVECDAVLR